MAASLEVKEPLAPLSTEFLRTLLVLTFCKNTFRPKSVPVFYLFRPIYELLLDFETPLLFLF